MPWKKNKISPSDFSGKSRCSEVKSSSQTISEEKMLWNKFNVIHIEGIYLTLFWLVGFCGFLVLVFFTIEFICMLWWEELTSVFNKCPNLPFFGLWKQYFRTLVETYSPTISTWFVFHHVFHDCHGSASTYVPYGHKMHVAQYIHLEYHIHFFFGWGCILPQSPLIPFSFLCEPNFCIINCKYIVPYFLIFTIMYIYIYLIVKYLCSCVSSCIYIYTYGFTSVIIFAYHLILYIYKSFK